MTLGRIVKVVFGIGVATVIGWLALIGLTLADLLRTLESFASQNQGHNVFHMWVRSEYLVWSAHGGAALALAAAISGIVLSEIFRTRSVLLYMIAAGALTVGIAATLSQADVMNIGQAASILAIGGFVAGAIYWLVAGRSA